LSRRGHYIRRQRQDGENNKDSRLTHLISPM
jgi:hypothetical protein